MAEQQDKGPCVSCKLRRKKCDRLAPCSRCARLNIPAELCVYQEAQQTAPENTLTECRARHAELTRQLEHMKLMKRLLAQTQRRGNPQRFHSGITETTRPSDSLGGYLNSITLPATISYPKQFQAVLKLFFAVLQHEKLKQTSKRAAADPYEGATATLKDTEDLIRASLVGAPHGNGDVLIYNLLTDLMTVIPRKELYTSYFRLVRERNGTGYIIGMPRYPAALLNEMESIITFNKEGIPSLELDLPKENHKLIVLVLTLMVLSSGQFVTSRQNAPTDVKSPENKALSSVFHRYANVFLQVNSIGEQIRFSEQDLNSPLLTLAQFLVHIHLRHSMGTEVTMDKDELQATALTTRSIVARAKAQHIHDDLEKYYPGISDEETKLYRDLWYSLVMVDMTECFELGYLPAVTVFDFEKCTTEDVPLSSSVRDIHEVLSEVNFLDGELDTVDMLEYLNIGIKKVKKIYKEMDSTVEDDLNIMKGLNPQSIQANPRAFEEYYRAGERTLVRAIILGIIQRFYCLCTRCVHLMGETRENSVRAAAYDILALKLSFTSLEFTRQFCQWGFVVGDDENNKVGNAHMLSLFHLITVFEASNSTRATMWLGYTLKDGAKVSDQELAALLLTTGNDIDLDGFVFRILEKSGEFDSLIPTFAELEDFEIDDDYGRLIQKFAFLGDPRNIVYLSERVVYQLGNFTSARGTNLDFIKSTKSFIIGVRFLSVALKIFFKDEVKMYYNSINALLTDDITSSKRSQMEAVDFAGSFKELFEQVIDSSASNQRFDLNSFFGAMKDDKGGN